MMNEYQLFTQPHDELLRMASDLGIAGASALPTEQLVHAIAIAQAAQKQGIPWAQTRQIVFRPTEQMQTALIRNPADQPVRLSLEVVDRTGAFTIPDELKDVVLQGNDTLSVPVHFSPPVKGVPITTSAPYNAGIHIWDRAANCIVATVSLSGTGPGYQEVPCMVSSQPKVSHKIDEQLETRGDLPKVWLQVKPEWVFEIGKEVTVSCQIRGAETVRFGICEVPSVILEDSGAVASGCWFGPDIPISPPGSEYSNTFNLRVADSRGVCIDALNAAGTTHVFIGAPMLQHLDAPGGNYYNVGTPGPVYRGLINVLKGFLTTLEGKLSAGCIRNNTDLDRFPNKEYLRGALTDDILTKMKNMVICTSYDDWSLPSAGRYNIETDPATGFQYLVEKPLNRHLCYRPPNDPDPTHGMFGSTPWILQGSVRYRPYVGICYQYRPFSNPTPPVSGADTLLHELYHYAAREDQVDWNNPQVEEEKAFAVQYSFYLI